MLTLLFNSYWAFGEFMTAQAATAEAAYFWVKVMFLWPFWIALLLHFTLVFTESRLLKKKLTYVLMYFPAAFFAIIDLTTNWISAQPVEQYWGYTYTAQETMFSVADSFWVSTIGILSLVLCAVYQHRVSDPVKKQQAKFVSIGLACPVVLSLVTDNILPTLGITFPSLSSLSGCFFSAFIAYAMWRYELFNLNAAVAAENIVNAMPDSLILANLDGRIIRVNDHVVELTGYSCQELDGKQFTDLFMAKAQGQAVLTALEANKELRDLEAKFQTKNGNIRSCLLSGSVVKNKNGRSLGLTFIVHDLTRFKQMEQRLVETERFASIGKLAGMVGHDLRNPLVSMNGATYYLKTRYAPKLDKNGLEMLDAIEKSIAYSNKIVNDLLDYSA